MSDTTTQFTPYAIAKVLNEKLTEKGLKNVPPQMMYNYARNGLINGVKGVKKYTQSECDKFVENQIEKRTAKVSRSDGNHESRWTEDPILADKLFHDFVEETLTTWVRLSTKEATLLEYGTP